MYALSNCYHLLFLNADVLFIKLLFFKSSIGFAEVSGKYQKMNDQLPMERKIKQDKILTSTAPKL